MAQATAGDNVLIADSGTTSVFQFEVNGAQIGKALVSLVETGDQNILTASAGGTTQFNLTRGGTIEVGDLTLGLDDTSATI